MPRSIIDRGAVIALFGLLLVSPGGAAQNARATPSTEQETVDWAGLRRPLDLPQLAPGAPCPRTGGKRVAPPFGFGLGDGPAYPTLGPDGVFNFGGGREDGGWFYEKMLWFVSPDDAGPILIRGGQLDGPNAVRFDEGADPPAELRLDRPAGFSVDAPGWRTWVAYTRVRAAGCYAYQVDGEDFSDVIVFQAVKERPGELTPLPAWENGPTPLPHLLVVHSGVRLADGQVRLALGSGLPGAALMVRLDVGPSQDDAPPALSGREGERRKTAVGTFTVLWAADPNYGWPREAAWDDGQRRYRLEVLDGDQDDWSEADMVALVMAFAWGTEDRPAPLPEG